MDSTCDETGKISREFDGDACDFCERYRNNGLSRSSKLLLKFILDGNAQDKAVFGVGCGAGGVTNGLLKHEVQKAGGFYPHPKMKVADTQVVPCNGFGRRAHVHDEK